MLALPSRPIHHTTTHHHHHLLHLFLLPSSSSTIPCIVHSFSSSASIQSRPTDQPLSQAHGTRHALRYTLRFAALASSVALCCCCCCYCGTASAKHRNHANCARGRGRRISGTSIQSTTHRHPTRASLYMRVHEGAHGACCLLRELTVSLSHTHLLSLSLSLAVSLYLSRISLYDPGLQPGSGEVTAATPDPGENKESAMQVLPSLQVPPYPDPYRSLTESAKFSSPTSQPPARMLTCMRPASACHPPQSILVSVPSATDHCPIVFPFHLSAPSSSA